MPDGKMHMNCPEPATSNKIVSKPASQLFRENWDLIFGKKLKEEKEKDKDDNIQEFSDKDN